MNFITEFIISLRAKFRNVRNAGRTVFEISIIKYIDSSAVHMETALGCNTQHYGFTSQASLIVC
jgi:hypothetical protein